MCVWPLHYYGYSWQFGILLTICEYNFMMPGTVQVFVLKYEDLMIALIILLCRLTPVFPESNFASRLG